MFGMFRRLRYTWRLMGASLEVLRQDKKLLVFPLLSGIACLLVVGSFLAPMAYAGMLQPPGEEATAAMRVGYYGILFAFYLCNYFVIIFFNTALVGSALMRLQGSDAGVGDGLRMAASRLVPILGWAFLSATVSVVLRSIENRSQAVGKLISSLLGAAWALTTFLAVPVLVVEQKGPLSTLRRSAALLKKTWGEQLMGKFSFGIIFFLLMLPGLAPVPAGIMLGSTAAIAISIALAVLYILTLALVQAALHSIFRAALYLYAVNGEEPDGFPGGDLLGAAIGSR